LYKSGFESAQLEPYRKAPIKSGGFEAAEKSTVMPILSRLVTGKDFNRADKAIRTGWAPAPAELILRFNSVKKPFSAACLSSATRSKPSASQTDSFQHPFKGMRMRRRESLVWLAKERHRGLRL
jgi:hypothetical protein